MKQAAGFSGSVGSRIPRSPAQAAKCGSCDGGRKPGPWSTDARVRQSLRSSDEEPARLARRTSSASRYRPHRHVSASRTLDSYCRTLRIQRSGDVGEAFRQPREQHHLQLPQPPRQASRGWTWAA